MFAAIPFLRRVSIRNYKSIGACDVRLGAFTLLVGRNGAGKSNFLDALSFVADALQTSLEHALKQRSGIHEVRRISAGHPHNVGIELELALPEDRRGDYAFEITARKGGGFSVKKESLTVTHPNGDQQGYLVLDQKVTSHGLGLTSAGRLAPDAFQLPPAAADRLYLVTVSGMAAFRPVFDSLSAMGFYNLHPGKIRELQDPDAGELLHRDGSNLASVVGRISANDPKLKERILRYLRQIVPEVVNFERVSLGPKETIQFKQAVKGSKDPWKFFATNMSDGTLRALGVLASVMQLTGDRSPLRLAGIEEPEIALHPAASGALCDALREASRHTQVLVTTHSPDLLDRLDMKSDQILVVESKSGTTIIAEPDAANMEALREHLTTAGELLRQDQLRPAAQRTFEFSTSAT